MDIIAGVDESGRGALAGPVVACCVTIGQGFSFYADIDDSKALSAKKRRQLFDAMQSSIHLGVGIVSHRSIDRINILNATLLAMQKAIRRHNQTKSHIIIDGTMCPKTRISCEAMVNADARVDQVKIASICAKVIRDQLMVNYAHRYNNYAFEKHKGYGTDRHYACLHTYGPSYIHRRSFNLSKQLPLF